MLKNEGIDENITSGKSTEDDFMEEVKINKGIIDKRIISVAIIALIIVSFGISPWGKAVIAEIKEKLIFTKSRGIINGE